MIQRKVIAQSARSTMWFRIFISSTMIDCVHVCSASGTFERGRLPSLYSCLIDERLSCGSEVTVHRDDDQQWLLTSLPASLENSFSRLPTGMHKCSIDRSCAKKKRITGEVLWHVHAVHYSIELAIVEFSIVALLDSTATRTTCATFEPKDTSPWLCLDFAAAYLRRRRSKASIVILMSWLLQPQTSAVVDWRVISL